MKCANRRLLRDVAALILARSLAILTQSGRVPAGQSHIRRSCDLTAADLVRRWPSVVTPMGIA